MPWLSRYRETGGSTAAARSKTIASAQRARSTRRLVSHDLHLAAAFFTGRSRFRPPEQPPRPYGQDQGHDDEDEGEREAVRGRVDESEGDNLTHHQGTDGGADDRAQPADYADRKGEDEHRVADGGVDRLTWSHYGTTETGEPRPDRKDCRVEQGHGHACGVQPIGNGNGGADVAGEPGPGAQAGQ